VGLGERQTALTVEVLSMEVLIIIAVWIAAMVASHTPQEA
jgi:hypothetical protein